MELLQLQGHPLEAADVTHSEFSSPRTNEAKGSSRDSLCRTLRETERICSALKTSALSQLRKLGSPHVKVYLGRKQQGAKQHYAISQYNHLLKCLLDGPVSVKDFNIYHYQLIHKH